VGDMIINDEIITIKNLILENADCEQIYLFGSYAYGTPGPDSDYDFYVVINDNAKIPILVMEDIYQSFINLPCGMPVDVLAQYKTKFETRSKQLTIEKKVVNEGVLLYDRHDPGKAVV
jgi:predicted nucleotidyltransferase